MSNNGYCQCGCGRLTLLSTSHYVPGHQNRGRYHGESNPNWKGGRTNHGDGYILIRAEGHPKAVDLGSYVLEHIRVVEKAIGRFLKNPECVHHINEDPTDNRAENLVLCPDQSYHLFLHMRAKTLNACGHADWRKCIYCKQYDDTKNMKEFKRKNRVNSYYYFHQLCAKTHYQQIKSRRPHV